MKTKKSAFSSPSPASAPASHSVAHDVVAERAAAIWRERGSPEGQDMAIWLEAERQLYARPPGARASSGVRDPMERSSRDFSPDPDDALKDQVDKDLDTMDEPPEQRSSTSL